MRCGKYIVSDWFERDRDRWILSFCDPILTNIHYVAFYIVVEKYKKLGKPDYRIVFHNTENTDLWFLYLKLGLRKEISSIQDGKDIVNLFIKKLDKLSAFL